MSKLDYREISKLKGLHTQADARKSRRLKCFQHSGLKEDLNLLVPLLELKGQWDEFQVLPQALKV